MPVSLPEKTLEHWLSIHLTYRYRAKVSLWWPSSGEDITAGDLPTVPGKQFWLEAKTVTWLASPRVHSLKVNLWQLWKYGDSALNPMGVPDYYVFPAPPFAGHITDPGLSWLAGRDKSWIGFQSKSGNDWFAHWTWVLPGSELRRVLSVQLADWSTHGRSKKTQFEIATVAAGRFTWAVPPKKSLLLRWRQFLELMDTCGSPGWGSLMATPRNSESTSTGPSIRQTFLSMKDDDAQKRAFGDLVQLDAKRELTYWRPGEGELYVSLNPAVLPSRLPVRDSPLASLPETRSLVTLRYDAIS